MQKIISRRPTILLLLIVSVFAMSFLLCGCGNGESPGQATSKIEYFSENEAIPTPSSIVKVNEKSHSTTTTNGVTGPTEYFYALAKNANSTIEDVTQAYIAALNDEGLETTAKGENQWSVAKDDSIIATVSISNGNLKVALIPESQQTTFKSVSLGEQVEGPDYVFTLTSVDWLKEIYPSDTSGGYNYYQQEPNKTYCVVKGTFKYTGGNTFSFKNTSVSFSFNDKYTFSGSAEYETYNAVRYADFTNFYSLEPFDEVHIILYASVADEVCNDLQSGIMSWKFNGNGSEYRLSLV